ncbi:hypothetical protein LKMONMHP_2679 [Methylobacterium organophilum]|uniref:DUF1488 domain-containing protein n=2 Tax=Methylobacterium organophilum TaxID=410 RepID=A0ABQ4TCM8_METOR|nr:hypothetical protein LKMONMHP_2679 [Methylobacterium organophilum]
MRISGFEAGIDKTMPDHVSFSITDDRRLIPCRIGFDAIHALADDPSGNVMTLFAAHQEQIVDAAIAQYRREGAPDGTVTRSGGAPRR